MDQHDEGKRQATVADSGSAASDRKILARMPALNAAEPHPDDVKSSARKDGRILGQGISTKLLVGGGILLVLAAVIPFLPYGDDGPKPGESPAPDADIAPAFGLDTAKQSGSQPVLPTVSYEPTMSFTPEIPSGGPDFTKPAGGDASSVPPQAALPDTRDTRMTIPGSQPMAPANRTVAPGNQMTAPDWTYPGNSPALNPQRRVQQAPAPPLKTAWGNSTPPLTAERQSPHSVHPYPATRPSTNVLPNSVPPSAAGRTTVPNTQIPQPRYNGRFEASRPGPGYYRSQAQPPYGQPAYGQPAYGQPPYTQPPYGQPSTGQSWPQANTNRPMTIQDQSSNASSQRGSDYQQNRWAAPRADYQQYYQADSRALPRASYPSRYGQPPQPTGPGVARFEGTIEKPSARTTYERTRSGLH